jgi:hypothetical protein
MGSLPYWIQAVLKRPALRRAWAEAWEVYQPLTSRLTISVPFKQSDRIGRFAHHVLHSSLPRRRVVRAGAGGASYSRAMPGHDHEWPVLAGS